MNAPSGEEPPDCSRLTPGGADVLVVSQPIDGGTCHHILHLVDSLDQAKFSITVACPANSELWKALEPIGRVRRFAINGGRRPALADLGSFLRLLPLVAHADIIHAHSSKAGCLARLAAVITGRSSSCVFTPHGWSFWAFRGWRHRLLVSLERLAARWCRSIIAVSAFERDAGLQRRIGRPEQYRVVPNGIMLERFDRCRRPVDGRVMFVGRLADQKRPDLAIRALAILRERRPGAHLEMAGDGPLRQPTERLVSDMGLSHAVRLLGSRNDVAELLSRASCLLLTSSYEACPLSALEGMAAGVPVLATRFGGVSEIIDDGRTGRIVDPDPRAIADALETLLLDALGARVIGAAGQAEVQRRFSRDRMAAETAAVYEEIIASAPSEGRRRSRYVDASCRGNKSEACPHAVGASRPSRKVSVAWAEPDSPMA